MFEELFDSLHLPLPDKNKYLERIGVTAVEKTDRQNLDALILAHQRNVPFENLDIFDAEADINLDIPSLFDKVVTRRRGGYCFELNAVFMSLLQALGYECYPLAVRVVWHATRHMPVTHRATVVIIDGEKYFCDVGFGGPSPQGAVRLEHDIEQQSGTDVFKLITRDGNTVTGRMADDEFEQLLMFRDDPADAVDFLAPNEYQSKSKHSFFKMDRMLNLTTQNGCKVVAGNTLKIHENGRVTERVLDSEASLRSALAEHFGIAVDFTLKL